MSSYATTTRHDMDSTYAIDNFFLASTYSPQQQQQQQQQQQTYQKYNKSTAGGSVITSSPTTSTTITSQSNSMTYDCLPQQPTTNTASATTVSAIPIENLSINRSIENEWMSPLGLGYSTDYNSQDMNFLFAYNDLVIANKEMSNGNVGHCTSTPSESSSSITEDNTNRNNHIEFQQQTTPMKGGIEQYRRFSMMDMSTSRADNDHLSLNYPYMQPQQQQQQRIVNSSSFMDFNSSGSLFNHYQQNNMMNIQKERSSMPNVFLGQHPTVTNEDYLNHHYQQEQTGQLTWQQSSLLQKRPVTTTPIEEEEDIMNNSNDLAKYNYMMHSSYSTPSEFTATASVSSPLKKHAKKRSMIEEVLHEDIPYTMPSVVSSISEPIPTAANWIQQHLSRKRTKSIRTNNSNGENNHPLESLSSSSSATITENTNDLIEDIQQQQMLDHHNDNNNNYIVPSDLVPSSSSDSNPNNYDNNHHLNSSDFDMNNTSNNNQVLAAMPRRQKLRYDGDNYTPKWVRYTGHLKEGYCDSCNPGKWLQLKNSAYWYHKQFYHGISSVSGKSFMKPLEHRMGKGDMIEGLCHQCHRFVHACNGKKKNNYMLWYRHAHKCHLYDKPKATSKTMRKLSITSTTSITPTSTPTSSSTTSHKNNNII